MTPHTPKQLIQEAKKQYKWTENYARNAMAAADSLYIEYVDGAWHRKAVHEPRSI